MAGLLTFDRRRTLVPTALLLVALTGCSQLSSGDIDAAETTVGYTDSTESETTASSGTDGSGTDGSEIEGSETTSAESVATTEAPTTTAPSTTVAPTTEAPSTTVAPTTEAPTTTAPPTTAPPTTGANGGSNDSTLPRTGPSEAALFVAVGSVMILAGRLIFDALGLVDRRRWYTRGGGAPMPPR